MVDETIDLVTKEPTEDYCRIFFILVLNMSFDVYVLRILFECFECPKLEHQTLGQFDNRPITPATQRIILKIVGFQDSERP